MHSFDLIVILEIFAREMLAQLYNSSCITADEHLVNDNNEVGCG